MGPKAPKDPTAKRPAIYVMVDAVIDGNPRENGKFQDICYLNGRIAQKISVICEQMPEEILKEIPDSAGFRKLVHSIGVTVVAMKDEHRQDVVEFALNCLPKTPNTEATSYRAEVPCDGSEVKILVVDYPERETDGLLGSFVTSFPSHETAKLTVCFYLNDGYDVPELTLDPPVDFTSAAYREMIERSLVQTGNLERFQKAVEKAKCGEEVTIAYLGGSITQGAGAKPIHTESYVYRSYLAFKERFGKGNGENVRFIKSGAGGTSSELGLTRYEKDVLRGGTVTPDILFIEYAVNDAGDETDGVCFESLVRLAMDGPGRPAVILLFSVFMNDWNLQERLIPIGIRYQLPMISIKDAVTPQFTAVTPVITKRQYFYDLFHPSNEGHRVMADCIDYFWEKAGEALREQGSRQEEKHTAKAVGNGRTDSMEKPAIGDKFRQIQCFDRSNFATCTDLRSITEGGFTEKDVMLQYVERDMDPFGTPEFPDNWKKTETSGNEAFCMELRCKDLLLVYKDSGNPVFGTAEVFVDGRLTRSIDPKEIGWDHCNAYIVFESDAAAEHKVEISMKAGDGDKCFTILGFGYTV